MSAVFVGEQNVQSALDPTVRALAGPIKPFAIDFDVEVPQSRWIWNGGASSGAISYVDWEGNEQTLPGVLNGFWQMLYFTKINSSGTTISEGNLRGSY